MDRQKAWRCVPCIDSQSLSNTSAPFAPLLTIQKIRGGRIRGRMKPTWKGTREGHFRFIPGPKPSALLSSRDIPSIPATPAVHVTCMTKLLRWKKKTHKITFRHQPSGYPEHVPTPSRSCILNYPAPGGYHYISDSDPHTENAEERVAKAIGLPSPTPLSILRSLHAEASWQTVPAVP